MSEKKRGLNMATSISHVAIPEREPQSNLYQTKPNQPKPDHAKLYHPRLNQTKPSTGTWKSSCRWKITSIIIPLMLILSTFPFPLVGSGEQELILGDDPPPIFLLETEISDYGIDPESGWNDTSFRFQINVSYPESNISQINQQIVQVIIDSTTYDMEETDYRDWNYSDGKNFTWNNDDRKWSKGDIEYYFYVNINGSEKQTSTKTFTIFNREPYMLEPPFGYIEVAEEFEWEGRATDEDLDPLNWTLDHNMTGDDWSEFEFIQNNTTAKIKIKCSQEFVRWFNLTVFDYLDNEAYWNWTVYCGGGGGTNYYWTGAGDAYQWDDYNNWVIESAGIYTSASVGEYPQDSADQAFINETSNTIYVKDGANSVLTIGNLKTDTGFSGILNLSVDMVLDRSLGHYGNLTINAGTYDVNGSADNQNNLDGNLIVDSSATLIEHEGIFIVQGAQVQEIRVQDTNALYKLTIDTSGTTGELLDNLTTYQITIGTGTTYKLDPATRGYDLYTNFSDVSGCGFVSTSSGTLLATGDGTNDPTFTSVNTPPTNYWLGATASGFAISSTYTTFNYHYSLYTRSASSSIQNTNFNYANNLGIFIVNAPATFSDVTITSAGFRGLQSSATATNFDNVIITGSGSADINAIDIRLEFTNSNFDTSKTTLGTTGNIISDTHDDIANAYKVMATTLSKSTITNDWGTGDDIQLISGNFTIDEASASDDFTIDSGATLVLNTATTHTFDANANLTNNGILKSDGTITTSSAYFDFYNTGTVWANNSTIIWADLVLPFIWYEGELSNTTLNNYSILAYQNSGGIKVNISSETYENKATGVVWHMNVSILTETPPMSAYVNITNNNLTANSHYYLFVNGSLDKSMDSNDTGAIYTDPFFSGIKHLRLQNSEAGGAWSGGMNISWILLNYPGITIYGILARFTWTTSGNTVHLKDLSISPTRPIVNRTWTFEDGTEAYEENVSKSFSFGLIKQTEITLTTCNDMGNCDTTSITITIINWFYWGVLLFLSILFVGTVYYMEKKEAKK